MLCTPGAFSLISTYQLPAIEVHAAQFAVVWLGNVNVEGLTLVDVGATICCHLQDSLLGDLPDGFVQLLQVVGDPFNVLRGFQAGYKTLIHPRKNPVYIQENFRVLNPVFTWMEPF